MSREIVCIGLMLGALGCHLDWSGEPSPEPDASLPDDAGQGGPGDAQAQDGGRDACVGERCGGCSGPDDCSGATPVCDDQACRGCARDAECGAGAVCIEADGSCAAPDAVAFVTQMGTDTGSCTRAAPCATLAYALAQAGERKVVHVLGGSLATDLVTIAAGEGLVLDGEDTALETSGATLAVQGASLLVEGFRFTTQSTMDAPAAVAASAAAKLRLYAVSFAGDGGVAVAARDNAEVSVRASHVGRLNSNVPTEMSCAGAKLTVEGCTLETAIVGTYNETCEMTVARNRFESANDGSVRLTSGVLVMENNLVIHRDGYNDSISVGTLYPGSTIRFNTIVNTTALPSDGAALSCDGSVVVTSNVFAYNSGHPITGTGCEPRYSVFDDVAATSAGTGNKVAGIETLFVDRAAGDYHLAADSVARAGAEPGLDMVREDYEGNVRPAPAGSTADCGAFEAP